jgi:signal peptidase I
MAVPGDTVTVEDGELRIGTSEPIPISIGSAPFFMQGGMETVPKNKFLVLGDNIADSVDSRFFGYVALGTITGSVLFQV